MLRVCDLDVSYGPRHVLWGVSLEVGAGEAVALLGRNGAGKSTTLKAIIGLVPVGAGRVEVQTAGIWRDIARLPAHERAALGIGYVPEERRIFPHLTVAENLRVGLDRLALSAAARRRAHERAFDLFPALPELLARPGRLLSGGEQQMLAIARVLVLGPRAILLDEPSQGLSPLLADSVLESVERLAAEGIAVLLVEQNALAALGVARRGYLMDKGVIAASGPAADLRADQAALERTLGVSAEGRPAAS
jgi:branched-chain amino acid transport system ATP-binding protein